MNLKNIKSIVCVIYLLSLICQVHATEPATIPPVPASQIYPPAYIEAHLTTKPDDAYLVHSKRIDQRHGIAQFLGPRIIGNDQDYKATFGSPPTTFGSPPFGAIDWGLRSIVLYRAYSETTNYVFADAYLEKTNPTAPGTLYLRIRKVPRMRLMAPQQVNIAGIVYIPATEYNQVKVFASELDDSPPNEYPIHAVALSCD